MDLFSPLWLLGFLLLGAVLAYWRSALPTITVSFALALIVYSATRDAGDWWKLACWAAFLALAVPLNLPALRRAWFTAPILATYRSRARTS